MSPTMPFIHSNGTGVNELLNDNMNTRGYIQDAIRCIEQAEFNRRDYYPVEGAWENALAERQAQTQKLQEVSAYFLAIASHCADERDKREAGRSR